MNQRPQELHLRHPARDADNSFEGSDRDVSHLRHRMSDREPDTPSLRTSGSQPVRAGVPLSTDGLGADAAVELVVDLLAATKLVPADKLALARGRAQQTGSLATALVEEGVASSEGMARMLASRHHLPFVDLALTPVDEDAATQVPLHVLERIE